MNKNLYRLPEHKWIFVGLLLVGSLNPVCHAQDSDFAEALVSQQVSAAQEKLTLETWVETFAKLDELSVKPIGADDFQGTAEQALQTVVDGTGDMRVSALRFLTPVMPDDGTSTFEEFSRLIKDPATDEEFRFHLVNSLSYTFPAADLISEIIADEAIGSADYKAWYIVRLMRLHHAKGSPASESILITVRDQLSDSRPIVKPSALQFLGVEDTTSETILMEELDKGNDSDLPLYVVINLVDPTKAAVGQQLTALIDQTEGETRMAIVKKLVIVESAQSSLWEIAGKVETEDSLKTAIIAELSDLQADDKFIEFAVPFVEDGQQPEQARSAALSSIGAAVSKQASKKQLSVQQETMYSELIDKLQTDAAVPQSLKLQAQEAHQKLRIPDEAPGDNAAMRLEQIENAIGIVQDATLPIPTRKKAFLELRRIDPEFYDRSVEILNANAQSTEIQELAFSALTLGIRDGKVSDECQNRFVDFIEKIQEPSAPLKLKEAAKRFEGILEKHSKSYRDRFDK